MNENIRAQLEAYKRRKDKNYQEIECESPSTQKWKNATKEKQIWSRPPRQPKRKQ